MGLNLSRITVHQLDNKIKQKLIESKLISEITILPPFTQYLNLNSTALKYFNDKTGVAVLDQTIKSSNRTNFNNTGYLKISKQVLKDDLYVIKNYPETYLEGIAKAFTLYFDSPTKYKLLTTNVYNIKTYDKIFNAFIYGSSANTKTGYLSIVFNTIIILLSFYLLCDKKVHLNIRVFIAFSLFNILYVMFVGNFLELGKTIGLDITQRYLITYY